MRPCLLFGLALLNCASLRGAEKDEPNLALAKACWNPNVADVKRALERDADPNTLTLDKREPVLHGVLWDGDLYVVELLLKSGARADLEDKLGRTALHAAAGAYTHGDSTTQEKNLRTILATGVDIHHTDHSGDNALVPAAGNSAGLVRILLDAGVKISTAAVESAVGNLELECLELLLQAGGDLHSPLRGGRTMMHAACGSYSEERVTKMLEKLHEAGLKVEVPDDTGMTPLLEAAVKGNWSAVRWLIAHGGNVRAMDNAGRTALLAAVESSDEEIFDLGTLIDAGCPLDAVGKAQVTAFDTALHRRWWETAHLFLRRGATPRDPVKALREALAVWREFPAPPSATRGIFLRLLRRIPDAGVLTAGGFPLLRELVFVGEPTLLKAALQRGVDVDARDAGGRTALMWAALTESESSLTLLRAAGADESLRDAEGKSAADLAAVFRQPPPPPPSVPPPSPPTDLFDAVAVGDLMATEKFIAADPSAIQKERVGLRPIHVSALNNQSEMTALLIKHGAEVETKSADGVTPFAHAAAAGHAEWCRWFIERAAPSARPGLMTEAAVAAIKNEHATLAAELLRAGWKPDLAAAQRLLLVAIKTNDLPLARDAIPLCNGNFPRDSKGDPFSGDKLPDVLDFAAMHAGPEVMELLLSVTAKQQPELWRLSVNLALTKTIWQDGQSVFDALLATNLVDARSDGKPDEAPLSLAVSYGRPGKVSRLLDKGHKPAAGAGLLRVAVEGGYREMIPLLLKSDASVDEADEDGVTALHVAASQGDEEIVSALLAGGASLMAKTGDGQTAADRADQAGFPDLADDLKARATAK